MDRELAQVLYRAGRMVLLDLERKGETQSIPYRALRLILAYLTTTYGCGKPGQTADAWSSVHDEPAP